MQSHVSLIILFSSLEKCVQFISFDLPAIFTSLYVTLRSSCYVTCKRKYSFSHKIFALWETREGLLNITVVFGSVWLKDKNKHCCIQILQLGEFFTIS